MSTPSNSAILDPQTARTISVQAGVWFSPHAPIGTQQLFAGRPHQLRSTLDAILQIGLHVVIFGERGVGKTSLANVVPPIVNGVRSKQSTQQNPLIGVKVNAHGDDDFSSVWGKALDEVWMVADRPAVGFDPTVFRERVRLREAWGLPHPLTIDIVKTVLTALPNSVFIFDEFDRLPHPVRSRFTDLLKALSDCASESTVILVGVSNTLDDLIGDHQSIARAIVPVEMPRMTPEELDQILRQAVERLAMEFTDQARGRIVQASQGLPHYTHLLGLCTTRAACERCSRTIELLDTDRGFAAAVNQADAIMARQYAEAISSAHSSALYREVLLACSLAARTTADSSGYFQPASVGEPLSHILQKTVEVPSFNKHLVEFCDVKRAAVLERTGRTRAFRYRFRNPLMPPFIVMKGVADNLIKADELGDLDSEQ